MKVYHFKNGFKPKYWIWTDHSEEMSHVGLNKDNNCMDASISAEYVAQHEQFMLMQDMVSHALRHLKLQTQIIRKNL